jgi:hypothetical protein
MKNIENLRRKEKGRINRSKENNKRNQKKKRKIKDKNK